jgi:hypothetical protein
MPRSDYSLEKNTRGEETNWLSIQCLVCSAFQVIFFQQALVMLPLIVASAFERLGKEFRREPYLESVSHESWMRK